MSKPLPAVGDTWEGAQIAAVHLYGDPLYPDHVEGVILGYFALKDEYGIWVMSSDREVVDSRFPKDIDRALLLYSQLAVTRLHEFGNPMGPVPALTFGRQSEES